MRASAYLLIVVAVMAMGTSCKRGEKATANNDTTEQREETKTSTVEAPVEEKASLEPTEKPTMPEREAPKYPDSLYFSMQRTPCFGKCPVYHVKIYNSGWALLEGGQFFDYQGYYVSKFTEEDLIRIEQMARKYGYAKMDHVYDAPVTDLPSTTTIIQSENIEHWVYNRMNSPDELREFELAMETMIKDKQWKPWKKGRPSEGGDVPE